MLFFYPAFLGVFLLEGFLGFFGGVLVSSLS